MIPEAAIEQRNFQNLNDGSDAMGDFELCCNFKKCKKILTETAFITRCSHIFCEEHAIREIQRQNAEKKCPACQSPLIQSYDLVKVVLNPTEQFKSMVLAGIRPEIVMDIATRAMMFWIYQLQQDNLYHKMCCRTFTQTQVQMKVNFDVKCDVLKSKILEREKKIDELEKEVDNLNRKCAEMAVKLSEKCEEVQRWQMTYETIRRKQISDEILQRGNNVAGILENKPFNIGPKTMDELAPKRRDECQNVRGCEIRREECGKPDGRHQFYFQPQINPHLVSPKKFYKHDGFDR